MNDERITQFLSSFRTKATEPFLAGYRAAQEVDDTLLSLFLIQQAAYEVAYEAANWPGWIDVPLRRLPACVAPITEAVA